MKTKRLFLLWLVILPVLGFAQSNLDCYFSPEFREVNSMNTASFDPFMPMNQPLLTTLNIVNNGDAARVDLKVKVLWNNNFLVEATFESMAALGSTPYSLSNRDLITNQSSQHFMRKPGTPDLSLENVVNANDLLKDAVLAGYFPDGNLQIRVWVREYDTSAWELADDAPGYKQFELRIRNAAFITLMSPGVPIGLSIPELSGAPLSFIWNSLNTGINNYRLVVREYAPNYQPDVNNVSVAGNVFYQTTAGMSEQSGFASYLPFTNGNYYAWRVETPLSNEFAPYLEDGLPGTQQLNSNWFVFRYASEDNTSADLNEFQARLNMLNNNTLLNLFTQGYKPVGTIIYDGRSYTGEDAYALIESLLGHDIDVELKD